MPVSIPPRYQIVPRRPSRRGLWMAGAVLLWAATVVGVWQLATWRAAPAMASLQKQLGQARAVLAEERARSTGLGQREATLAVSERISRSANGELQATLAERDEEIAGLRADLAFYERLVGATGQRKGLSVHQAEFLPDAGGAWQYQIMLTQSLNRGAISQGQMRFAVEGVRSGKLATIGWDDLQQKSQSPGQPYSFRYFQQLDGRVMLPAGFTPQRVKVQLAGQDAAVEQAFDWKLAIAGGGK